MFYRCLYVHREGGGTPSPVTGPVLNPVWGTPKQHGRGGGVGTRFPDMLGCGCYASCNQAGGLSCHREIFFVHISGVDYLHLSLGKCF